MKVRKYRSSNSGKWTNAYKSKLNRKREMYKRTEIAEAKREVARLIEEEKRLKAEAEAEVEAERDEENVETNG